MSTCGGTRKDGKPCNAAEVAGTGYCARHVPVLVKGDDQPLPRVRPEMRTTYQRFLEMPAPAQIQEELALLRAAQAEMVEIIENRREEKVTGVAHTVVRETRRRIEADDERDDWDLDAILEVVEAVVLQSLMASFRFTYRSLSDVREIGDMLLKIVKAADVLKKHQEGTRVVVDINAELLSNLLRVCIYPVVTVEQRVLIIQKLQMIGLRAGNPPNEGTPDDLDSRPHEGVATAPPRDTPEEILESNLTRLLALAPVHASPAGESVAHYDPCVG